MGPEMLLQSYMTLLCISKKNFIYQLFTMT